MKKELRMYKQGEAKEVYKKFSQKTKDIINWFIEICSITAGAKKLDKVERILIRFVDTTKEDLTKKPKVEVVNKYLKLLNNSDYSFHTKNEDKVYLKRFLLKRYKDLDLVENFHIENRRAPDSSKINEATLITEEEVERLLSSADNSKEKAYVFCLYETGARPQELLNLKWKDVIVTDTSIDLILHSGKTGETRTFPLNKSSRALEIWKTHYPFDLTPESFVFPNRVSAFKSMTSAGANKILKRLGKRAGLKKPIWNYLFRHTRATRLYEEIPQQITEKLMGHKNMADVYAHISNKKAKEVLLEKVYQKGKLEIREKTELEKMKEAFNNFLENFKTQSKGKTIVFQVNNPEQVQELKHLVKKNN